MLFPLLSFKLSPPKTVSMLNNTSLYTTRSSPWSGGWVHSFHQLELEWEVIVIIKGVCMYVCVFVLWFKSTPVDSYNLSSHYFSLALRDTPRLGVVVTLASISKIIGEAQYWNEFNWIHHSVHINTNKHIHVLLNIPPL